MKHKLRLLSYVIIIGLIFNSNILAQNYFGDGTAANPYKISSEQDLYDLTRYDEDWGAYIIQVADINITNTASFGIIGTGSVHFTGSYDGQGYTISNLIETNTITDYTGLFGYIEGATIKNLHLTSVTISGVGQVGGLVGYAVNSTITDCSATGSVSGTAGSIGGMIGSSYLSTISKSYSECTVVGGDQRIGGFIGYNSTSSSIEECYATGSVSATQTGTYGKVGGFVGENISPISKCFSTGSVNGNDNSYIGGFAGYNLNTSIELCYSTGDVTGGTNYTGGFAGNSNNSSSTTQILRCYSTGNVSGTSYVGGFIGHINASDVKNSFSTGSVTRPSGKTNSDFGGFSGKIYGSSNIEHCYSTGSVSYTGTGDPSDKGFVGGENSFTGSYVSNYFDGDASNQSTATGATSATTTNMQQQIRLYTDLSFPGTGLSSAWDFNGTQYNDAATNDYWKLDPDGGYPILVSLFSTTTNNVSSVTDNSATAGGHAFNTGSERISERGVCWSTSSSPTISDSKATGNSSWNFTADLTGLSASTTYYVRAYVTNSVGTSYGDEETFTTDSATPVELTSFTGKVSGESVVLDWNTATEVNNYGFQVERQKAKGESEWENIGFVEGHGNSNSPKDYSFVDSDKLIGMVKYRLKQIDIDGAFEYSGIVEVNLNSNLPAKFELTQNYPNPFNPTTTINYAIPSVETRHALSVQLTIYDALGREVATLVNETKTPGNYSVQFDASKLSSGIYYYTLRAGDFNATKKMILMK